MKMQTLKILNRYNNMKYMDENMIKYLAVSILAILSPIIPMLITVFILIVLDLITGIWAALKRSEKITSGGIRRTITKIFVYDIAILSGLLIQKYLIYDSLPIIKLIGGIIASVEGLSIYENLNVIYGSNIFKKIINIFGSPNDPKFKDKPN